MSSYPPTDALAQSAHINAERYKTLYEQSINAPDAFWGEQARNFLTWQRPFTEVFRGNFAEGDVNWFGDGTLNLAENCIDRHLPKRAHQTAIIWEGDNPNESKHITYQQLHDAVGRFANLLKNKGVKKGDRVCIYMPMIPEAVYAMLASARIGAVHSVVFGGFSPEALKDRILDAGCKIVITADEGLRAGKAVPLKNNTDRALDFCPDVETVIVVKRTGGAIKWFENRDCWYSEADALS
ncbi:MAG: acetyl-coenzyme A synthetase, partial [Moraxellaceae bacterium]